MTPRTSRGRRRRSALSMSMVGLHRRSSGYRGVLWRFGIVIILFTITGGLLAAVYTRRRPVTYSATAAILVTSASADTEAGPSASPEEDNRSVANAVALAQSRDVAADALDDVGEDATDESVDDLRRHLDLSQRPDTSVLEIEVTDQDPERAAALANAVGEAYQTAREKIPYDGDRVRHRPGRGADVRQRTPRGGHHRRRRALLGLVLGVTVAFVLEQLRVEGDEDEEPEIDFRTLRVEEF